MNDNLHSILKEYWGYDQFRPLQEEIMRTVLSGQDTLALLPTGGGKSLCYQVPGMAREGLCLVISPLIALMKDQVENLRRKQITAYSIYSGMTRKEVIGVLKVVTETNCKFLYVSPERLETRLFKEYLPGMGVSLIAVDEAHCISQWGYDFRPPYLRIAALREELPGVPVLALTASATEPVQQDIRDRLTVEDAEPNWKVFRQSFARPNLSYSIFEVDSKINKIVDILSKVPGTGIVYCRSRKRTREISDLLQMRNISADFYHAGLSQEDRNRKQEEWIQDKIRVIVCTNAFGMGIDKPGVRSVIHADVPDCLENYYQEAGRAGRDGKRSYAVLLFDHTNLEDLEKSVAKRFPSIPEIRETYQAVANYLQLHTGDNDRDYHDFFFPYFVKKFGLDSQVTLHALKALEQNGWMAFNEQVFLPAMAQFTITKDRLYAYEREHPEDDPLIKTMLRTYEGIFDQLVPVSEGFLAYLMQEDQVQTKARLFHLHRNGIIEYRPQKDIPQVMLLHERVKAEQVTIDVDAYNKRKEQYLARLKQMMLFVNDNDRCRSRFIGAYFGDDKIEDCGICDNCLRKKSSAISKEAFAKIHSSINTILIPGPMHSRELLAQLGHIKKDHLWQVLDFMQGEGVLRVDKDGTVEKTRN